SSLTDLAASASAWSVCQASSSSSPGLNLGSTSAARVGTAANKRHRRAETSEIRYFKTGSLGQIFEIALDLLFHLRWNALFEGVEDFFAKIARRLIFVFARQAEFFGIQTCEAVFDIELGKLRHARQRHHQPTGHETPA